MNTKLGTHSCWGREVKGHAVIKRAGGVGIGPMQVDTTA